MIFFFCFNALLNILDSFVYVAGDYIKEDHVNEVLVVYARDRWENPKGRNH